MKLIFVVLFSMCGVMEVSSQNIAYEITRVGINNIKLNANISTLPELRILTKEDTLHFKFSPSTASFYSLKIGPQDSIDPIFILKNAFVATDSGNIIKKIVLFLEARPKLLAQFLDAQFLSNHIRHDTYSETTDIGFYSWYHFNESSDVRMSNLSQMYRKNVIVLEFNGHPATISKKYDVMKKIDWD